jgi:drug/metabolite transporter (DMT)-like permease
MLGLGVALGVNQLPTAVPEPLILGQMLWIGVLSTALAIPIWNAGVSVLGVGVASLFANLTPVLAVAMSVALGAEPTLGQLIGGLVVIAGVIWVQVARLRP